MVAPIAAVGSMMVKGVFKGGGLLTGLGSMVDKFKRAGHESKSTTTEMKRMTGHAHVLRNALGLIGVGGFSALLMQSPALAGSLVKIKTEMMLIANSVGRVLKPALDSVAVILQGIRTGDWTKVKEGVKGLAAASVGIVEKAAGKVVDVVLEPVIGESGVEKIKTDFKNWKIDLVTILEGEGPSFNFMSKLFITPLKWLWTNRKGILSAVKDIMDSVSTFLFPGFREDSPLDKLTKGLKGLDRWSGQTIYDITGIDVPGGQEIDTENKPKFWGEKETSIETQANTFNITMNGVTGDLEDPSVLNKLYNIFTEGLRENQRSVTY